jgi:hypothetical protein
MTSSSSDGLRDIANYFPVQTYCCAIIRVVYSDSKKSKNCNRIAIGKGFQGHVYVCHYRIDKIGLTPLYRPLSFLASTASLQKPLRPSDFL